MRKAALAGVLALRPRILLLDEPTSGLDPQTRSEVWRCLLSLNGKGVTLVIATHNMDEAAMLAHRIYVLNEGKIAMQGGTRNVFGESEKLESLGLGVPFTASLMAALRKRGWEIPSLVRPGRVKPDHARPGRVRPGRVRPGLVRPGHAKAALPLTLEDAEETILNSLVEEASEP